MTELLAHLSDQPIANLVAIAGLVFLFIAAVGKVVGKIEPDARGRVMCGVLGIILLPIGMFMHVSKEASAANSAPSTPASSPKTPEHVTDACIKGFVWRLTVPDDHVCVTKETRNQVESDNLLAPSRVMNEGAYGADTCKQGFVWREAVPQDHVCVVPDTRESARHDNDLSESRKAP